MSLIRKHACCCLSHTLSMLLAFSILVSNAVFMGGVVEVNCTQIRWYMHTCAFLTAHKDCHSLQHIKICHSFMFPLAKPNTDNDFIIRNKSKDKSNQ